MNIFLANVGNRDLAYNLFDIDASLYVCFEKKCEYWHDIIRELELSGKGTRIATEKININFGQYQDRLIVPIIFPSLEFVLTKVEKIDSLVLLVTDNPKENQQNWIWDTIEAGKIIEKLIRADKNLTNKIKNIKIVKAEADNPNEYDAAYKFISHKFDTLLQGKIDNVFTAISGGLPAMNSALRSYTIERFGVKTHLIQKDEPLDDDKESGIHGRAKSIDSWIFRKTLILRLVKTLLERYDYEGVLELLKNESVNDPTINKLCAHGKARFNFDFKRAEGVLSGLKLNSSIENLKNSASNHTDLQRISEIAFIAQILLERGDLIGFLTRTASFRELVINIVQDTLSFTFSKGHPSFADKLNEITDATKKMPQSEKKRKLNSILKEITWNSNLHLLCELRNDSLHHGRGIDIYDIEKVFPNCKKDFSRLSSRIIDNLLDLKRLLFKQIQINEPSDIYNDLNQMILQFLGSYKA